MWREYVNRAMTFVPGTAAMGTTWSRRLLGADVMRAVLLVAVWIVAGCQLDGDCDCTEARGWLIVDSLEHDVAIPLQAPTDTVLRAHLVFVQDTSVAGVYSPFDWVAYAEVWTTDSTCTRHECAAQLGLVEGAALSALHTTCSGGCPSFYAFTDEPSEIGADSCCLFAVY